jgi:methionine biosynthesis protein MetW
VGDVDEGLDFPDKSFDFVVINVTLQMVYRPGFVLREALRVGGSVIVSFPNVAHIVSRLELLLLGRYPRLPLYGYNWHDTRHIHLFSYKDFVDFVRECGGVVQKSVFFGLDSKSESLLARLLPNLFSRECILLVEGT